MSGIPIFHFCQLWDVNNKPIGVDWRDRHTDDITCGKNLGDIVAKLSMELVMLHIDYNLSQTDG